MGAIVPTLTRGNIANEIEAYLARLRLLKVPTMPADPVSLFIELKRGRVEGGPYNGVSLFETANRVMSDFVVLFAAARLLERPLPGLPLEQLGGIEMKLGTQDGFDLRSRLSGGGMVLGECFNVARSFFGQKRLRSVRGLEEEPGVAHRILAFNVDAVARPDEYGKRSSPEWSFILIDVLAELQRWRR